MALPLQGVKVLDFSRLLPGPFCSMLLGDFGAEILRVEEPGGGVQASGRRHEQARGAEVRNVVARDVIGSRPYEATGRNKRSIVLDLKHQAGQEIARKLAAQSDVVLTEFRPGVTKRLGIDYDTVRKLNRDIVYCAITLYGQDGPYHHLPGHEPCTLAIAGVLAMNGDVGGPPRFNGVYINDISTALHATIGILLALRARDLTGEGQLVDTSMLDSALDFQAITAQTLFMGKRVPRLTRLNPSTGLWQCRDGKWICTTNVESHHWANFCRSIGREDLIPHQYDRERLSELHALVQDIFRTRTQEEWLKTFWEGERESQAAPVCQPEEVFDNPQVKARQMVVEMDHPEIGSVKQLGISIKLSRTPGRIGSFAPPPGENTREVLASIGYSSADTDALAAQGVLG